MIDIERPGPQNGRLAHRKETLVSPPSDKQFIGSAPYFLVRNLEESLDYYHNALGFDKPKLWGDPPEFAVPSRDGFIFMLKQVDEGGTVNPNGGEQWDAYVWINDVDTLFAHCKANGGIIEYEPCIQKEYDMKEFAVRDLDGYVIALGQHYEG